MAIKFEFDSTARYITPDENDSFEEFRCLHKYEYRDLCKILLSDKQFTRHCALSYDGIYYVSKKRYLKGVEFIKSSPWRKRHSV